MRKLLSALFITCLAVSFGAAAQSSGMSKKEIRIFCGGLQDKPNPPKETLQQCIERVEKENAKKEAPKK